MGSAGSGRDVGKGCRILRNNDVLATEAVFDHLQGDFTARKDLSRS